MSARIHEGHGFKIFVMSAVPSTRNTSFPSGHIFVKLHILYFY